MFRFEPIPDEYAEFADEKRAEILDTVLKITGGSALLTGACMYLGFVAN